MENAGLKNLLRHKFLNGWPLFLIVSTPISLLVIYETLQTDLSTGAGISHLIGFSVLLAVPFIYLVIATSSLHILFPSHFSAWLMKNRKFFGFCFAVAMAWQGLYILIVSTVHRGYYFNEIYYFRDELEGTVGYVLLGAMVITSFSFARKYTDTKQWKLIQKTGVYFLWAYPFSVYWWNLFYYPYLGEVYAAPRVLDYILYAAGFAVFALRIFAWGKQRLQRKRKAGQTDAAPMFMRAAGALLITVAAIGAVTGAYWQNAASTAFAGIGPTGDLSLWIPFWPLEPFLPLLIMGLGVLFWTALRAPQSVGAQSAAKAA